MQDYARLCGKSEKMFGGYKSITYLCGRFQKTTVMPTVFRLLGYRFFFYGNDHTPIHIHVEKGSAQAKYELFPLLLIYNHGFKVSELKMIEGLIEENQEIIAQHWNKFFNNAK